MDEIRANPTAKVPEASPATDSGAPAILLVDDKPARLLTYEALLSGVGVTCVRALSGEEALNRLLKQSFALILLDVSMPGMDGFETARMIREHPRFERTPIIFVTGVHVSELDSLRGYEVGAIDYISVPIVPEILRSKVTVLVELHQRHRQLQELNRALKETRAELASQYASGLANQRQQYEAILSNTPDLAYVFDLNHRFTYANEGLLRMWGKTREEAIGKTCLELGYEPWHAAMHDREIDQIVATKKPIRGEVPFTGTSGRRDFDYLLVPVFGPDNAVIAVAGTTRDITERKQMEESLRQADRRKDEFIAMLAHELRNPLVPIRTAVELLKKGREQPAVIANIRPMMERQVTHMVRLIDDLLDVSRFTSGKLELKRETVSLSVLIGGAMDANREALEAAALHVSVNLADPHLVLNVDPTRFTQILSNIIQNASKFTPKGGRITIRSSLDALDLNQPPKLVIGIADTGVGIAAEMLPDIFELFAQAGSAGHGRQSGLGIGLALARRLAELHGGSLEARSEGPGKGSEFVLSIPLEEAARTIEGAEVIADRCLEGVRIQVIDDNHDAADIVGMLIAEEGGIVRVAYDGTSGIQMAQEFEPAVAIVDIGLPDMDGYEACRRLRAHFERDIGIIALTGWGQERDKQLALESGFDAHMTKPASPQELSETVRRLWMGKVRR